MKKWSKIIASTSVVAITMGTLVGCGSTQSTDSNKTTSTDTAAADQKPVDGGSVTLQTPSDPDQDLNPDIQNSEYDQWVYVQPAYEKLLNEQADGTYTPALASSYDISSDKKTITFHIRQGAKWSDGQPITADDIVFTYNLTATKEYQDLLQGPINTSHIVGYDKLNSKNSYDDMVANKVSLDGVKKIDDNTVSVTFDQPLASMLYQANQIYPIPKHIWASIPINQWKTKQQDLSTFVVSGPFKLTDMKAKEYYTLERNDNYYGNRAHLDKITWKVVPAQTAAGELKNGELDLVSWPKPADLPLFDSIPNLNSKEVPSWSFQYLGFNCSAPFTEDKALRQAIAYSIDRDSIIKALFKGHAGKMDFPIPLQSFAYPKDGEVKTYNFDPAKAKQVLKDAGYKLGPDGKWQTKDGKPMKLTLSYPKGNVTREEAAPMYVQMMQSIGLDVTLNPPKDFASYFDDIKNGKFQMYLIGSDFTTVDPDQTGQWSAKDPANYNRWINNQTDALVADSISAKAFDINYRRQSMLKWEALYAEELPEFVLYNEHDSYYWSKRLHGVKEDNRVFDIFYDFENWWVDKK